MILDTLENATQYQGLHPLFPRAFAFLQSENLEELPLERIDIDGDRLFAIVSRQTGRSTDEALLEAHRKYIDIQLVIGGEDRMGWKQTAACSNPTMDYSAERDVRLFDDQPDSMLAVKPGQFALFFPGDAHMPSISSGEIHKVIIKVAV